MTGSYGKLTVISEALPANAVDRTILFWLCRCSCGHEEEFRQADLLSGKAWRCSNCEPKPQGIYFGNVEVLKTLAENQVLVECVKGHRSNILAPNLHVEGVESCPKCAEKEGLTKKDMMRRLRKERRDAKNAADARWAKKSTS